MNLHHVRITFVFHINVERCTNLCGFSVSLKQICSCFGHSIALMDRYGRSKGRRKHAYLQKEKRSAGTSQSKIKRSSISGPAEREKAPVHVVFLTCQILDSRTRKKKQHLCRLNDLESSILCHSF